MPLPSQGRAVVACDGHGWLGGERRECPSCAHLATALKEARTGPEHCSGPFERSAVEAARTGGEKFNRPAHGTVNRENCARQRLRIRCRNRRPTHRANGPKEDEN